MTNAELFEGVRALNIDPNRYAITGSGPLGIRELREISDVDLVVDDALFDELAQTHTQDGGRLAISDTIEAFRESAFTVKSGVPTVCEQIRAAERIAGLPFVTLEMVLAIKKNTGREKDLTDTELIASWLDSP